MNTIRKLIRAYFSREALPYWYVIALDSIFVILAGIFAFALNHGISATIMVFVPLMWTLFAFLLCFIVGFRLFHTYDGVIRYSSFKDLIRVSMAVAVSIALVILVQAVASFSERFVLFSAVDIILFALVVVVCMWLSRVWVKTLYEGSLRSDNKTPAFILGVKAGGAALAKNMNSSEDSPFYVAGFVADTPELEHRHLMGESIYPFDDRLDSLMRRRGVRTLIVSPLMMNFLSDHGEMIERLAATGVKIMVVPEAKEWDGKSDLRAVDLKPIDVEDLLPREKIEVDMQAAADLLHGNVVMITGAAGSIGSEMVRQIAGYEPSQLILVDQAETPMHDIRLMMRDRWPSVKTQTIVANIADKNVMERIFSKFTPQYVFHAAAYKHVPMMEDNPYESVINNVYGTRVIADLAVKYRARKFVMVSTDKAVNPTNVMGCSKRICEIYVQSLDKAIKEGKIKGETRFVTTRFGNVLGSNGSVIPLFQEQIQNGGPVTVTHPDIIRFFMLIPEACKLVIEAGTMGNGGEIYVFDMGKPVKIADLAKRMIKLSGAKDIEIKYTGLRDGEKLYEEVLNDQEITLPTFHSKIKIAKVREYDFSEIISAINDIIDSAPRSDDMEIVAKMKAIVPEFKSQHSIYEALDKK